MILCDTNILIEFYKGNSEITQELKEIGFLNLTISTITAGELYFGARDKHELGQIKKNLSLLNQVTLDADISEIFLALLEEYALSHRLSVPDALIAATALSKSLPLYTLNLKDFHFIPNLQLHKL
ncbi:MAG TPA: type II toxin-antitoxin system VapC family toxin [Anaerolineales bacterium]|nr:type II toxin-antitoxin system VapC family toxin [Anaerolineales bacterium]HMS01093.1 type II toxin-antitoxin system VapC family toxin [Anaerolineales bacterium]HNQ94596.1 type II toxin-antitoxin system VapC family toxin [Anaerolineales bacterium]HNS60028.1 type II toxin-antitoxin system VapC family toxin [Anaerolineales bacterium]